MDSDSRHFFWSRAEDVRAQLMPGNARDCLDLDCSLCRDATARAPVGNHAGVLDIQSGGGLCQATESINYLADRSCLHDANYHMA